MTTGNRPAFGIRGSYASINHNKHAFTKLILSVSESSIWVQQHVLPALDLVGDRQAQG